MTNIRRLAAALAIAISTVTAVGAVATVAVATATPSGAQLTCTDNWVGPTSGTQSWDTSTNWSGGTPGGSSVACIQAAGTYTVVYDGTGTPAAVQVGGATSGTQTLEIDAANMATTEADQVEGGGVLDLAPTTSADAEISGSPALTIDTSGTLTSSGTSNVADIQTASLVNQGTVSLGATNNTDDAATTNAGSFTVEAGSSFNATGAPSFTDASGNITNDGSFTGGNVFTQSGGDESGNPVVLDIATYTDSAGTGSFTVLSSDIEGTIPAGQTVTNVATNDTIGTSSAGVTVEGTLICETTTDPNDFCDFSSGYNAENLPDPGLTVVSGGTLETAGPGSAPLQNVQMTVDIEVDAGGTMSISNPDTLYEGGGYSISNSGTLQVSATGELTIGGSSTLTNSGGTIAVTTGVGSGDPSSLGGIVDNSYAPAIEGGTLAVTTVGSPGALDVITDTANGIGGSFAGGSFGSDYYTITYAKNEGGTVIGVEVTPGTPFSASATSYAAAENEVVTTPQVASITTNAEPGTYSATVNYGDGSPTQPATVNPSGGSATVTGPTHTYTAPGSYTVAVTISTTAGTTVSMSESIIVTGPTITGISPDTLTPGDKLMTTVSGTNFDGTGAPSGFTTSDPTNLSIKSVVFEPATKKKPALYVIVLKAAKGAPTKRVSLTLTQTGTEAGVVTQTKAIKISP